MIQFPKHKCGLFLSHNEHKDYYEPIEQFINDRDFKDKESKQRCIDTNELWELHWYPNTPVSFYSVCAPTLEEVIALALEVELGLE